MGFHSPRGRGGPPRLIARLALAAALALGTVACSSTPTSPSGATGSGPASASGGASGGGTVAPGTLVPEMTPAGTAGTLPGLIVFAWRSPSQGNGLATTHPDGTGRTLIPDTSDATEPALSPDRTQIAYTRGGAEPGIWIMQVDGSKRVRVAHLSKAAAEGPAWSPDGKRIAFVGIPDRVGDGVVPAELWVVDADGTHLAKIPASSSGDRPAWSPDGTRIAFASFVGSGIYSVKLDGTGLAPITGGSDLSPAWSPDGHRLAFQRQDESDPNHVVAHIFTAFSDGSNVEQLTQGTTDDQQPTWSPDGHALAYAQFVTTPNGKVIADLIILSADGAATNLTSTPDVSEYLPSWR